MTKIKIILATLVGFLAIGGFLTTPPTATAHDGFSPHAEEIYANAEHVTFDKDQDVGDGWGFGNKVDAIDSNFLAEPVLWNKECENTAGPCLNVQELCAPEQEWMYQYDRNFFGGVHGRIRLNRCNDGNGRDESASCRVIMLVLGSHSWAAPGNNTCLDEPWFLSEDHASNGDFDALNTAYNFV